MVLGWCLVSWAGVQAAQEIDFKLITLKNGLRVVLHQDKSTPIVCVDVAYHVGSKNEVPGRTGFAHLFEHLMFDGSTNVPRGAFSQSVSRAGGMDNAFTDFDWTDYYEILPSNQLELALWLESDRMMQFGIKEISLQTQREVVKEERRFRYDNVPYGTADEKMVEALFKVGPYNHSVIGHMDDITAATLDDVRKFYEDFYGPNNAVLVLAGDIDFDRAEALARKYFEPIAPLKKPIVRDFKAEPEQTAQIREVVKDHIDLPAVYIGFRIPPDGTREAAAMDLLSAVMTNGQSSRLYQSLVYQKKMAQSVDSESRTLEKDGYFVFEGVVTPGTKLEALEAELWKAIDQVVKEPISDKELEKVKNHILADKCANLQTVHGKAVSLGYSAAVLGDPSLVNQELPKYESITKEEIQKAAAAYCKKERSAVIYYVPEK